MKFKDIILEITVSKVKTEYFLTIDGVQLTPKLAGAKYGVSPALVRKHLAEDTVEEFTKWLQDKLELRSLGITNQCNLFKKDGEVMWSTCLVDIIGCSVSTANDRLNSWVQGKGDLDDLCDPRQRIKEKRDPNGGSRWGGLTNKKRGSKLKDMKTPSAWEKRLPEPSGFTKTNVNYCVGTSSHGAVYRGD